MRQSWEDRTTFLYEVDGSTIPTFMQSVDGDFDEQEFKEFTEMEMLFMN